MKERQQRINAEMQRAAQQVIGRLKDPRITSLVSVMRAEVTNDLKYAKIYLSVFDTDPEKRETTFKAIENCRNFIRHELTGEIQLRCMPELKFVLDETFEKSQKINDIIDRLHKDEKKGDE